MSGGYLGNYKHNCEVLKRGQGTLIVTHRPTHEAHPDEYGPCETCYAYMLRKDLWRYKCQLNETSSKEGPRKRRAVSCKLPPPPSISQNLNEVICAMRTDGVYRVIKSDDLILAFGGKL